MRYPITGCEGCQTVPLCVQWAALLDLNTSRLIFVVILCGIPSINDLARHRDSREDMTKTNPTALPAFENPPLVEVALSVQFEPLDFAPVHLGILALELTKAGYGRIEVHPPLQPVIEELGPPSDANIIHVDLGQLPRHWFISGDGNSLIQIQSDRFILNWRKVKVGDTYPRYESIRKTFEAELNRFTKFVAQANVGEFLANQAEVSYVNHVQRSQGEQRMLELADVVTFAGNKYSDGFLPTPEGQGATAQYLMGRDREVRGRLHVSAQTAIDLEKRLPIVVLTLTARGAPLPPDLNGTMDFMDIGRDWVVRAFADVTTFDMQRQWRRNA